MKQNRKWLFNFLYGWIWLSFLLNPIQAWSFEVPPLTGPVVDQVGLISSSVKNQLEHSLYQAQVLKPADVSNASGDASAAVMQPVQLQVLIISSLDTSLYL